MMEDYQIRDALRRGTTPELEVELSFSTGNRHLLEFPHDQELSNIFLWSIALF